MRKFILTILGIGALALMVGLNMRHAANNYGMLDNNLANEVLAQTSSSSGSGSSSGSTSKPGTTTDTTKNSYGDRDCNENGGRVEYFCSKAPDDNTSCVIYSYLDAGGEVGYNIDKNDAKLKAAVKSEVKKEKGFQQLCNKTGNGCTVVTCRKTQ
jgi:hypothetical protein